jgi:hypothetical protein
VTDRCKIFGFLKMDIEKKTKEMKAHEGCLELLPVEPTGFLKVSVAKAQLDNGI